MSYHQPPPPYAAYPPPPPPKKSVGCLTMGLWTVGGLVAFGLLMSALSKPKNPQQAAKEKADLEAYLAAASASAEAQHEEARAMLRKDCKLKPDASVDITPESDVKSTCRDIVRGLLKSPSSAEFERDRPGFVTDDGCRRIYVSSVEALNPFGVKLRNKFECTWDPRTGNISAKMLP